jgi:Peptidase A4 family
VRAQGSVTRAVLASVGLLLLVSPPVAAEASPGPVSPTVASRNWAGYASAGSAGSFSSISARWTQPRVACPKRESSYAAFWVGLDGYGSKTVEQIGTASECRSGKPVSYAWYEIYPKHGQRCSITIDPGDRIDASVLDRSGRFELRLSDGSRICRVSARAGHRYERSSAEVIVEAPSSNHGPKGTLDLANFGSVSFTRARANGDPLAKIGPDRVVMRSPNEVKARPGRLRKARFSVAWLGT